MSRFLEFVANHPILWTLAVVLLLALAALELRNRARGTINLSIFDFTRQLNSDNNWNIVLDLGQFFNAVNLDRQKSIMSPCADAVLLSRQVAKCFRIR